MSDTDLEQADDQRDLRDDLFEMVLQGEITRKQAENRALEGGLRPLVGRADPASFDPMTEISWTPLMAVAWIVFRDVDQFGYVTQNIERNARGGSKSKQDKRWAGFPFHSTARPDALWTPFIPFFHRKNDGLV
jgi:hypothetical protein